MNYITPQTIEFLKSIFDKQKESPKKEKKQEVWKIRVNGEFFKTEKGKNIWNREHYARAAFVNFVQNSQTLYFVKDILEYNKKENNFWKYVSPEEIKNFIKQLEEVKILEFVRVV